jgi:hypothetical protein
VRKDKDKFKKGKRASFSYEFANPLAGEAEPEKNKQEKNK